MSSPCLTSAQIYPLREAMGGVTALARVVISDQLQLTGIKIRRDREGTMSVVYPFISEGVEYFSLMPGALRESMESALLDQAPLSTPICSDVLEITEMRVERLASPVGKTQAYVSCVLEGQIVLRGMRVVLGVNGLFLAHPNDPGYRGDDYRSLYYPLTKALRDDMEARALAMYSGEYDGEESYNSN